MNSKKQYEFLKNWLEQCNLQNNYELHCMVFYNDQDDFEIHFNGEVKIISNKDEIEVWQQCFNTWLCNGITKRKGMLIGRSVYIFQSQETIDKVLENLTYILNEFNYKN